MKEEQTQARAPVYSDGFLSWLDMKAPYLDVPEANDTNVLSYARDIRIEGRLDDAEEIEAQVADRIRNQANALLDGEVPSKAMIAHLALDRDICLAGLHAFRGDDYAGRMVLVTVHFAPVECEMPVHTILRRRRKSSSFRVGAGGGASSGAIELYAR